jgi:membrane-anchored glycerophosphoryl diester phosphodiesterase (GDPDase)
MQSLLLALREGREPKIGDLFSEMRLFLPLFAFGLLAMIATTIGFMLFVLPGFAVAAFIVFATIYVMPLMTDKKMGLLDAVKESWRMAVRKPVGDQVVLMVVYLLLMSLGSSIAVAVLFTQPLASFLVLSVYRERQGQSTPPPIDFDSSVKGA